MNLGNARVLQAALTLGICAFGFHSALAVEDRPGEVGFLLGAGVCDGSLEGRPTRGVGSVGPVVGVRGGRLFGNRWNWFGDATTARYPTELAPDDFSLSTLRTGVEYLFETRKTARWFLSGAAGAVHADYAATRDFDRALVSAGIGQRWRLTRGESYFRWELRADRLFGSDGFGGTVLTGGQILVGWSLAFGALPLDRDGDGVMDRSDSCPNSPSGARVDPTGCPLDGDEDRVADGLDRCPNTPKGTRVDSVGCPFDADADGVPDSSDRCADTPAGAEVDVRGCPKDTDGDTILDGIDRCPNTPREVFVDPSGCPLDLDGDGVPNGIDRCLDTPKGAKVDARGCPVEK